MAVLVGPTRVADVLPIDVARAVHLLLGCAPSVVGEGISDFRFKVESWPIGLYRHPPTKTGRSRPYLNQFSSGLEGGQFMKPFVGWYTFKLWDRY